MIYRKLTASGDYSFGQSAVNFYVDIDAVVQAIKTNLLLYQGSFWRVLNFGLPMFQNILGTPGSPANLTAIDNLVQGQIASTQGVIGITSYNSTFDKSTRQYQFNATVQTQYSTTVISGVL